jgi:nitrite reductase (NADH) small subunit
LATGEAMGDDNGCTPTIAVRMDGDRIWIAAPMQAAA